MAGKLGKVETAVNEMVEGERLLVYKGEWKKTK